MTKLSWQKTEAFQINSNNFQLLSIRCIYFHDKAHLTRNWKPFKFSPTIFSYYPWDVFIFMTKLAWEETESLSNSAQQFSVIIHEMCLFSWQSSPDKKLKAFQIQSNNFQLLSMRCVYFHDKAHLTGNWSLSNSAQQFSVIIHEMCLFSWQSSPDKKLKAFQIQPNNFQLLSMRCVYFHDKARLRRNWKPFKFSPTIFSYYPWDVFIFMTKLTWQETESLSNSVQQFSVIIHEMCLFSWQSSPDRKLKPFKFSPTIFSYYPWDVFIFMTKLTWQETEAFQIQPNNFQLLSMRCVYCYDKAHLKGNWSLSNSNSKSVGFIGILEMKQLTLVYFSVLIFASRTWGILILMATVVPLHSLGVSRLLRRIVDVSSFSNRLYGSVPVS